MKAIWPIRGGYGCEKLIEFLTKIKSSDIPKTPKLLIGFSDITALLLYFYQSWGWKTIHGPVLLQLINNKIAKNDVETLKQLISGQVQEILIDDLRPMNECAIMEIKKTTTVTGGNLSLIQRTIGTPQEIIMKDKILFMEEVNEPYRKIDGFLNQMKEVFFKIEEKKPVAIILGTMSADEDEKETIFIQKSLEVFAKEMQKEKIPVLSSAVIGHSMRNHPIPIGPKAELILSSTPKIIINSGSLPDCSSIPVLSSPFHKSTF